MIFEEIHQKLKDKGCGIYVLSSGYGELEKAIEQTVKEPIDFMIEIGTYNGLSAALFTYFAKRVFTFDVCLRNQEYVWELLGVRDKINSMVSTRGNLEWEINWYYQTEWKNRNVPANFNFAFIDGSHDYEIVKADFELVKFCKRILFHDYSIAHGVNQFCKEIGAVPVEGTSCAYWEET